MLEFMEMLAVFEASRKSMLPAKYQAMPKDEFNQRFELLKASLNVS